LAIRHRCRRLSLALYLLSLLKSLTFDEIVSFSVAAKPLAQIWSYVKWKCIRPCIIIFCIFGCSCSAPRKSPLIFFGFFKRLGDYRFVFFWAKNFLNPA